MAAKLPLKRVLTISPTAFEKCFLVAEALDQQFAPSRLEYGLIGLASASRPLHVLTTVLLPGQQVTPGSVYQPGINVMRLREEIGSLSCRWEQDLCPTVFVHRHPHAVGMSCIDRQFLTGTLIDQISTGVVLEEEWTAESFWPLCECPKAVKWTRARTENTRQKLRVSCGLAFSLIVNHKRDFSIDAAVKTWCPFCRKTSVRVEQAALEVRPYRPLGRRQRRDMLCHLRAELADKMQIEPAAARAWGDDA